MERFGFSSNRCERGEELIELVKWQIGFGARVPGSVAHRQFTTALKQRLAIKVQELHEQSFTITLSGEPVLCTNLFGVLRSPRRPLGPTRPPLLLGTHFDTRPIADNEEAPALRQRPILGANDGGSGTAILIHLLDLIERTILERDIILAFFDAEDVGGIDGNLFSMGSRYMVVHPPIELPREVIILDMVGGRDMIMNIDAHIYHHNASRALTEKIRGLAAEIGLRPFLRQKRAKTRYIICDHIPFLMKGIPSCLLIDLDYPEWHTQRDLPEAMSGESLAAIEELILTYLNLNPFAS
jgi:hypothetical protein